MASSNPPKALGSPTPPDTLQPPIHPKTLQSPDSDLFLSPPAPSGRIVLNLDRVMLERKISLGDLADQVGISNVNLSKIKNNHVTAIRFSTLAALCKALNCQVSDLLEYHPE